MATSKKTKRRQGDDSDSEDPHIPGSFPQEESDPASGAPPPRRADYSLLGNLDTGRAAARPASQSRHSADSQIAANDAWAYPYARASLRPAELAERAGEVARTRRRDREDQRGWYQQPLHSLRTAQPQPFDQITDETMHAGNDASDVPEATTTTDAPSLQERIGYRAGLFDGYPFQGYGYQPAAPARPLHPYRRNAAVQINGVWAPPPQPPPYPGNYEAQMAEINGTGMYGQFPEPDNHVYPRVPPIAFLYPLEEQMRAYHGAIAGGARGPPPTANAFAGAHELGAAERARLQYGAGVAAEPGRGLFQQVPPYTRHAMPLQERRDRGQRCHVCLSDAVQSDTSGDLIANAGDDNDDEDDNHVDDDDKVTLEPNICPVHDVCKRCLKGAFKMALKAEVNYPPQACCHFAISRLQAAPGAERYVKILGNDFVQRYKAKEKEYKTPHKQRTYCANLPCGAFLASTAAPESFPTVDEVRAMVPEQGVDIREVLRHFQPRLGSEGQRLFNMLRGYVSHDGRTLVLKFPSQTTEHGIQASGH
ncbi:hypothetical protein LTS18_010471, partial [Coniosporium uncinatum]